MFLICIISRRSSNEGVVGGGVGVYTVRVKPLPYYGDNFDFFRKRLEHPLSFVQLHCMEMFSVVWNYSRNILEIKLPCYGRDPVYPVLT